MFFLFIVQLNDDCLLEVLRRMDIEAIATMFLVSNRFHELIRRNTSIFIRKRANGNPIFLDAFSQPPIVLHRFFLFFGDYIHSLFIDDLCMFVAIRIVGFCPQLEHLIVRRAEMTALDFLNSNMGNLEITTIL